MILLNRVTKVYPGDKVPALDEVTLHIQAKEFVFLVGKSGAGKSTLMKMLTREEQPTKGKILVGGIDYDHLRKRHIPHLRRRLGVVFQDFKLLPNRTVYENVAFALEIAGVSSREIKRTVPTVLELVGLIDKGHKFPADLSGGERQRVAIARSMARQPKILIADEPTGNLDPETSWGIVHLLEEINNFGTTILVTTHNEEIVNTLQRRVVTLKDGKIIGDQKKAGHYDLEAPVEKRPIRAPGYKTEEKMRPKPQIFVRETPAQPQSTAAKPPVVAKVAPAKAPAPARAVAPAKTQTAKKPVVKQKMKIPIKPLAKAMPKRPLGKKNIKVA